MRVLAIVHQPDAGPGVFADAARDAGATLDSWLLTNDGRPARDPLSYDAVMTFGGAMDPDQDDRHPWMAAEKRLLAELIGRGVPLLGVCLGAELIAAAAGASPRRLQAPEIGWYDVEITEEGRDDPLLGPLAPRFEALQWHSYESPLPPGAVPLARSTACPQAYRVGPAAWGIQFHAEVTIEDFESWLDDYRSDPDAVRIGLNPEQLRACTRPRIGAWNEVGRALCERFLRAVDRR
jgi:GMP synthase (glutamine-hydrolysing)